tara:strand:- start:1926 stop:2870 length:945 start_codon:yes stop_codon:yes gene_type:complete
MDNLYKCERCNYTTNQRSHFIKHLNRKYICKTENKNISIEEIKKKYGIKIISPKVVEISPNVKNPTIKISPKVVEISPNIKFSKFSCDFCNKSFKHKQSIYKHLKNCLIKKQLEKDQNTLYWKKLFEQEKKEKEERLLRNEEKLKQKQEMIDKLVKQIETLLTKVGNGNTTNNTTINQNIIIRNFGNENISYLTNNFFKRLLYGGPFASIPRIVKRIHFNEKHPENMNLKLKDKDQPFISVFEDNEWKQKNRKDTIKEIVNEKFELIDEKYEEVKDGFDFNKKQIYKLYKDRVKKQDRIDYILENTEKVILENN